VPVCRQMERQILYVTGGTNRKWAGVFVLADWRRSLGQISHLRAMTRSLVSLVIFSQDMRSFLPYGKKSCFNQEGKDSTIEAGHWVGHDYSVFTAKVFLAGGLGPKLDCPQRV